MNITTGHILNQQIRAVIGEGLCTYKLITKEDDIFMVHAYNIYYNIIIILCINIYINNIISL